MSPVSPPLPVETFLQAGRRVQLVNEAGEIVPQEVVLGGLVSEENSTSTPLGPSGTFIGIPIEVLDHAIIYVNPFSDVPSATDGLSVEQGPDGVNWDSKDVFTIPADGKTFSFQAAYRWYRTVYTNGAVAQSEFRLQTVLKKMYGKPSSHRLQDDIVAEDDAELVKAVLSVQTNDEITYKNIDAQNPLPVDGDSVYAKDLNLAATVSTGWTSINGGTVSDLFGDEDKGITFTGSDNPKSILFNFRRPVITTGGLGLVTAVGDFSNVKLIAVQADGTETVLVDFSAVNTDLTILPIQFSPTGFNSLRLEFHTADVISFTGLFIPKAATTIARLQALSDIDATVENISSYRSALQVDAALVHKIGIGENVKRDLGAATTLITGTVTGDVALFVDDITGFAADDFIVLSDGAAIERGHFEITAAAGSQLTLNRPVDNVFAAGSDVTEIELIMNVLGTLANPISYKLEPQATERWQLTRMMITMLDGSAMDDGKFGGLDELANGVVVRQSTDGVIRTLSYWQSNSDMKDDMFDVTYSDKAPAGEFGLSARWTFTRAEFVVDLDGAAGDFLEVLIQDDLQGLIDFRIKVQGRLFGG